MARNPKPVRRRYKAMQAARRAGAYRGLVPTYDDLNRRRPRSTVYALVNGVAFAVVRVSELFRGLSQEVARSVRAGQYRRREDFALAK